MKHQEMSFSYLLDSLKNQRSDEDRCCVEIADIVERIKQDIRVWENLEKNKTVEKQQAYQQAYYLYHFAEKYLLNDTHVKKITVANGDNTIRLELKTSEEDMARILKHIEKIEHTLTQAQSEGHEKLASAILTLLDDARKWQREFENNRLSYEDTDSELRCLKIYALDLANRGENECNLDAVKEYLTK